MPTDLVTVDRVIVTPTQQEGVTRYDINAHVVGANLGLGYETTNPWIASLLQQVAGTERVIRLLWKQTKYGRQIRDARLA